MYSQVLSSCRRVAVFSDIHSNYDALKVCVEDAIAAGAEGFIFLGDYVSGLAEPAETMDLVYGLQERFGGQALFSAADLLADKLPRHREELPEEEES